MITAEKISTILYWAVVVQICVISVSIAASSLMLGLIILSLVALAFLERRWPAERTPIDIAVLGYAAIEFLTAFTSDHIGDALRNTKRLLLIGIVYAVVRSFTKRSRQRNAVMLLSGSVAVLSLAEIVFYYTHGIERLYVFQHYMTTGGLKMIVSLLLLPFIMSSDTDRKDRLFFTAAFIPTLAALVLTNTRSAWMGLVFGILVIAVLHYRVLFGILVAAILLFFQFGPQHQVDRAKSIVDMNNPTNVGRFNMWSTGLRMWQDRPLLGFGDIDLYDTYLTYRTPTGDEPAGHLHNNYVHLLVTLGAVGLAVVLFLFFTVIRSEYRVMKHAAADPFVRNAALGGMAVFTGFMVNGLFEWNFGDHEIMVFVWFTVGLVLAAGNTVREGA